MQSLDIQNRSATTTAAPQVRHATDEVAKLIDISKCIGCKACLAACPYGARYVHPEGYVDKCTFCLHRTREGRLPACLEACPTGARVFGNILDPDSEIRWVLENKRVFVLKEELGTKPRFYYFFDK